MFNSLAIKRTYETNILKSSGAASQSYTFLPNVHVNIDIPCKAHTSVSVAASDPFSIFAIILIIWTSQGVQRLCLTNYWGSQTMLYNLLGSQCPMPMLYYCFIGAAGHPCHPASDTHVLHHTISHFCPILL